MEKKKYIACAREAQGAVVLRVLKKLCSSWVGAFLCLDKIVPPAKEGHDCWCVWEKKPHTKYGDINFLV